MPDLIVAGAGMAGLVAAVEARSLGAEVALLEKGDRAGGSMLLSSGVAWRHRDFDDLRSECPGGDPALQRTLFERLDDDLGWLESLGGPVVRRDTGNPRTVGARFDPTGLTRALCRAAGGVELAQPLRSLPRERTPVVLATGGFQAERALVRRHITPQADRLLLRAAPWSTGDGLRLGLAGGAEVSAGLDQFYGRNMPVCGRPIHASEFVPLAQLYAHHATVTNLNGDRFVPRTWSEIDVVQWTARQPQARALYRVERQALQERAGQATVGALIDAARRAGASVEERDGALEVPVVAGITTTLGGLRIDAAGRAAEGLWACGGDAGGIATGGYASGLAAALVFGRLAARSALES
jgi:fumarate reductase flavoprotein subunit